MALYPATQRSATYNVAQYYPGDIVGGRTAVNLGTNGYFALGDLTIGAGCFLADSGNQVSAVRSVAGSTAPVAGIVPRNQGMAPMSFDKTLIGWSMTLADGMQATVVETGDVAVVVTGVDSSGAADHDPTVGETIFVSETDGSLACSTVETVSGYVASTFKVSKNTLFSESVTLGTNQLGCLISSNI